MVNEQFSGAKEYEALLQEVAYNHQPTGNLYVAWTSTVSMTTMMPLVHELLSGNTKNRDGSSDRDKREMKDCTAIYPVDRHASTIAGFAVLSHFRSLSRKLEQDFC